MPAASAGPFPNSHDASIVPERTVLTGALALAAALFVIVLLHELGHFVAARWSGMSASVFSVGFGKRLWGFRWRGTDFRISAIPLGGYVRVDSMEETVRGPRGPLTRFDTYPWGRRAGVIVAGVLMNLVLALGIYLAIPLIWGAPEAEEARIAYVDAERLPEGAGGWDALPRDARVNRLGGREIESVRELSLAVAGSRPGPVVAELEGGRTLTLTIPEGDEAKLGLIGALVPGSEPLVGDVLAGSPGERAGLRPGDRIVAVDGVPIRSWQSWIGVVRERPGRPVPTTLLRDGVRIETEVVPAAVERDGVTVGAAGLGRGASRSRVGLVEAGAQAVSTFGRTLATVEESWAILLKGRLSARQVAGPVTIVSESVRIYRSGWETFLGFVAFLSINLALVNFLPIPGLDGGYFAMLGMEAVRREPVPAPVQGYLARAGMIWLVLLMGASVVNDLLRLVGY